MTSKDCQNSDTTVRRPTPWLAVLVLLPAASAAAGSTQHARMWSQAVVVDEQIRVGDLCELVGFEADTHERLRNLVVVASPPPGGSKAISLRQVRELIAGAGINMAQTIVKGAAECGVSRPRVLAVPKSPRTPGGEHLKSGSSSPAPATLREAVIAYFDAELSRYQSRVQVDFGRRAGAALELGGPEFDFEVRRRTGRPLGLIDIEVAIQRADETVQKVQLQPIVSLSRRVVVARRAINLQASIRPEDVQVVEMTFNRLDRLGVTDPDQVIGQRARQFIAAGTMLKLRDLESVPLVKRGQLVDVVSRAGGIVVVTTAKAMGSGALGELVELRGQDRGSQRLVGVVTGPRRVELRGEALAAADRDRGRLTRAGGRR